MNKPPITYQDFEKVDLRVGKILSVEHFPEARTPAYKLTIDFGPDIGIKKSSAQCTTLYSKEELVGHLVVCVVNFPKKQIGPFLSEVLTCGANLEEGKVALLTFNENVPIGSAIY